MSSTRADLGARLLDRVRDALGAPLVDATVSVVSGEARVDVRGRCVARAVPTVAGWHVDLAPELGDAAACAGVASALRERLPFDLATWALVAGWFLVVSLWMFLFGLTLKPAVSLASISTVATGAAIYHFRMKKLA